MVDVQFLYSMAIILFPQTKNYINYVQFYFVHTFPIIQASPLVAISTKAEGVHVTKTNKSAIERFSKNKFVERPSLAPPVSLHVKITIITNKFPNRPTAKIIVKKTRLVIAVYSGSTMVELSLPESLLRWSMLRTILVTLVIFLSDMWISDTFLPN